MTDSDATAWGRFLASTAAPPGDRTFADDFDLEALAQLAGDERTRAETFLLHWLATKPADGRVAAALAIVGTATAVPGLRAAFATASGFCRFRLAAALGALDPAFDPVPVWLELLRDARNDSLARAAAAHELGRAPAAVARPALFAALADPAVVVRANAFGALVELHGVATFRQPPLSPLRALSTRLLSDLSAVIAPAVEETRVLFGQLAAGMSPADAGLAASPNPQEAAAIADLHSWVDGRDERPLDPAPAVASLGPLARHLLQCLLLGELHHGKPRVADVLAAMGSTAAIDPLREVLAEAPVTTHPWEMGAPHRRSAFRAAAALALETIAGDGSGRAVLAAEGTAEALRALALLDS